MMIPAVALLLKATAILTIALTLTRVARNARAAARHLVLAATFLVLALLPLVTVLAPAIRVPVPMGSNGHAVAAALTSMADQSALSGTLPEPADAGALPPRSTRHPSVPAILAAVYGLGIAAVLLPLLAGLRQTRVLRRSARRWRMGRTVADEIRGELGLRTPVDVLLDESAGGPMTAGMLRPAIVFPPDVQSWPADEVRRALVHELEHVRRADWITQCLTRVVCAGYWFHPVAWVAWRNLCLEAERACDDAVLRACGSQAEATEYADQLVVLAQRRSRSEKPVLAMAGRHDLAARVRALLDVDQRRGPAGTRWVALAGGVAALLLATVSPLRIVAAAKAPQAAPSSPNAHFDAATIRPCRTEDAPPGPARGTMGGTNATFSPGHMNVPCVTLEQLIYLAYAGAGAPLDRQLAGIVPGGASDNGKVRGGPAWVHSQHSKFAVEAAAAGASDRYVLVGTMLQALLEDRFKLKVHRSAEDAPMYAMTLTKGGLKIKPIQPGDCVPFDADQPMGSGAHPTCGSLTIGGDGPNVVWRFSDFELSSLASRLSGALGAYVIDRTGIRDKFMLRLEFHPDESTPGIHWRAEGQSDSAPEAASIFTALDQQIGVKLEKTRGPREFLVIDHVEPLDAGR